MFDLRYNAVIKLGLFIIPQSRTHGVPSELCFYDSCESVRPEFNVANILFDLMVQVDASQIAFLFADRLSSFTRVRLDR